VLKEAFGDLVFRSLCCWMSICWYFVLLCCMFQNMLCIGVHLFRVMRGRSISQWMQISWDCMITMTLSRSPWILEQSR